jgi:Tol biopolymer transport system component
MQCMAVAAALAVPTSAVAESLVDKLLRIAGLTAAPGQLRDPDAKAGSIWIANLERGTLSRLTADRGYRSPVFSPTDASVFALRDDVVVRIPLDGSAPAVIQRVTGAVKLVGFDGENPDELVVLLDGGGSPLAVLSLKSRQVAPLPYDANSNEQQRILAKIHGQERVYGTTRIYLKTERKQGLARTIEWTDVYLQRGDSTPQNVSGCDGVNCAQPALSPDGRRVAFVKEDG